MPDIAMSDVSSKLRTEWIPADRHVPIPRQKLMLVFHGYGDSLESFRSIKSELRCPEMNYLLVNAPFRLRDGFGWYALEPRHVPGIRVSRASLFKLIENLKRLGWRSENIYFLGHSQGALMVCDLLMNHPDTFGGAIGISGYVYFFRGWKSRALSSAAARTPWLMTYGSYDRLIPPAEIREDLRILTAAGLRVEARAFRKGHDFDFRKEVPYVRRWLSRRMARRPKLSSDCHYEPSVTIL